MRMRRLAAATSLALLLGCSSLGLCWKTVARLDHGCCQRGGEMAPARACTSVVEQVSTPSLLPTPSDASLPQGWMVVAPPCERPGSGAADTPWARMPSVVLRI